MLPSILAKQLQKGIGDYIQTTFPMALYCGASAIPCRRGDADMLSVDSSGVSALRASAEIV